MAFDVKGLHELARVGYPGTLEGVEMIVAVVRHNVHDKSSRAQSPSTNTCTSYFSLRRKITLYNPSKYAAIQEDGLSLSTGLTLNEGPSSLGDGWFVGAFACY